ncbi:MAG: hypothetical protein ACI4QH_00610 [Candidatus Fimimonas sp.]
MEFDGVKSVVCDAEESDWLDVSYSERYVEPQAVKQEKTKRTKFSRVWKVAVVAVLCVAILSAMLFLDGDFKTSVFNAVKTAVSSVFDSDPQNTENKINIPCNLNLVDVNDGVMTFNGGRAATSLTAGTVKEATEDSVTVALDENTCIVYSQLTSVFVKAGDEVLQSGLLGKYDAQYTATILQNGEVVKQVVGSETQLSWNV